jgi:hypothetical protein
MKILANLMLVASASLLTACGGNVGNGSEAAAPSMQSASVTTVTTTDPAELPLPPLASPLPQRAAQRTAARPRMVATMDGLWLCRADDGQGSTLRLDIAGNAMRDIGSQQTVALSLGKGIQPGIRLLDYHDKDSGQLTHARKLLQINKPGFASIFIASANAGAGTGAEFSLNPNDTLKISDYSSMSGTESVGQIVPMTCNREPAPAGA